MSIGLVSREAGRLMASLGLIITFLLSGLWHGAGWNFVIFGLIHVVGVLLFRTIVSFSKRIESESEHKASYPALALLSIGFTYIWVCTSMIFFRAQDAGTAFDMIAIILSSQAGQSLPSFIPFVWLILAGLHWLSLKFDLIEIANQVKPPTYGVVLATFVVTIITAIPSSEAPFIYFQF